MQKWNDPKKQAALFVFTTFLISWIEQYFIITGGGIQNQVRTFALMWTPGLVGILYSYVFDRNFKALAFTRPTLKAMVWAYFVPALTAVLILGLLLLFKFAEFEVSPKAIEKKAGLSGALFAILVLAPTIGMLVAFVSGLGEEIGWRGFLHTKLQFLTPNKRYLLTGFIWSMWHWPLIIFGDYSTSDLPFLNVLFFTGAVMGVSFFMGLLRDKTNSVFPAALVHGSHNMWILGIAPAFYKAGPLVPYVGGESGAFCALIYAGLALFIARKGNS